MELKGVGVVLTGASGGIGLALEQRAARPLNPQTQMNRATQPNAGYRKRQRPAARSTGR